PDRTRATARRRNSAAYTLGIAISLSEWLDSHKPSPERGVHITRLVHGGSVTPGIVTWREVLPRIQNSPAPSPHRPPLRLSASHFALLSNFNSLLGIIVEDVPKIRRQLLHLNWAIVGGAYELVWEDRRVRFAEEYTRQVLNAVAEMLKVPGGKVKV
ncbi:MAG: hypothetical protein WBA31_11095, partial [Candidatus Dormiibacterota bacterium]